MKSSFLKSSCCFLISLIVFQCESDLKPQSLDQELTVENAGEKHNEMAIDFLNHHQNNLKEGESSSASRIKTNTHNDIVTYLDKKYGTGLENSPYYIFKGIKGDTQARILAEEFDPYKILEENRDNVSEYFYSKFESLLKHTEHLSDNPEHVAAVIDDFKKGVRFDENFSQEERENFLLLLDVHQSSLELWTYVEQVVQENNPEGRLLGVPRGARWKIVASDFVGGIRGGILGGGAPGALAGLVAGSLIATISLWENRIPACSSADIRGRLSTGSILGIRPIRPRGSSTYTGSITGINCNFYRGGC